MRCRTQVDGNGREVGALEGLPPAENDRMAQRYRLEPGTLAALAEKDAVLVGQAELLRSMEGVAGDAMLAGRREIEVGIAAIPATLRERQTLFVRSWGVRATPPSQTNPE